MKQGWDLANTARGTKFDDPDPFQGLESAHYIQRLQEFPELYTKILNLKEGEPITFFDNERNYLINLVAGEADGISNLIIDITHKIWGTRIISWTENGDTFTSDISTLWTHFPRLNSDNGQAGSLLTFFLSTTKEEAEAEIAKWSEWRARTNIELK